MYLVHVTKKNYFSNSDTNLTSKNYYYDNIDHIFW